MAAALPSPTTALFSLSSTPLPAARDGRPGTNTKQPLPLAAVIPVEVGSALIASAIVTPMVAIIDKAVFLSNSQPDVTMTSALKKGVREFLRHPVNMAKTPAFRWVYALYAGTYLTANTVMTLSERLSFKPELPKFVASASVNVAICVLKDKVLTTLCGNGKPHRVAASTLGLYGCRDALSVFASFTVPPHLSRYMTNQYGADPRMATLAAQVIAPAAVQVASAPLHLLGLDIYNHPNRSLRERLPSIRDGFLSTTVVRMARTIPAFGVGGIVNTELRDAGRSALAHTSDSTTERLPTRSLGYSLAGVEAEVKGALSRIEGDAPKYASKFGFLFKRVLV